MSPYAPEVVSTHERLPDGTLIFWRDHLGRVELPPVPLDRSGQHYTLVYDTQQGGEPLNIARVKWTSVRARYELAQGCLPADDETMKEWLKLFVSVVAVLSAVDPEVETRRPAVRTLAQVEPQRVDWLWKPLLPVGRPVSLEGNPGIGKSNVVMKIVAHLTTGRPFPTVLEATHPQHGFAPCTVCLLTAEDDAGDTLLPRLEVNGGKASLVHLIDGWHEPSGAKGLLTLQDLRLLERVLEDYAPRLLVVDPLQAFFGRGLDMNHANETRPVLADVAELCKAHRCTILYVRHLAKAHKEQAIYAAMGSIDISAHVRSALLVGVDPDNPTRRILAHHKASNAPEAESLAFTLTSVERELFRPDDTSVMVEASRVDWDGLSPLKAADLLQPRGTEEEQEDTSALGQAREFLQELLQEGPVLAKEVHAAAKEAGVVMKTLHRAKVVMRVKISRLRQEGKASKDWPWQWRLLDGQEETPP